MSFNKNTWSKDYTGARGLKLLAAADAVRKGFTPKHAPKGARVARTPKEVPASRG